jgi:hypothetical protein
MAHSCKHEKRKFSTPALYLSSPVREREREGERESRKCGRALSVPHSVILQDYYINYRKQTFSRVKLSIEFAPGNSKSKVFWQSLVERFLNLWRDVRTPLGKWKLLGEAKIHDF